MAMRQWYGLWLMATFVAGWVWAQGEWRRSAAEFAETVAVPEGMGAVVAAVRVAGEGVKVVVEGSEGARRTLTLRAFADTLPAAGAAEAKELPEAGVEVVETRLRYYVRPKVAMLKGEAREKCVKEWAGLPSAGTRGITVGVANYGGGVALTIEGRY
ncbi:MAG: hypothetical protein ABFD96_01380, partial [Armatimonadia bacterium]